MSKNNKVLREKLQHFVCVNNKIQEENKKLQQENKELHKWCSDLKSFLENKENHNTLLVKYNKILTRDNTKLVESEQELTKQLSYYIIKDELVPRIYKGPWSIVQSYLE